MSDSTTTCPYCNSMMAAPGGAPGRRVACARCGEFFTPRPADGGEFITAAPPAHPPREDQFLTATPPAPRASWRPSPDPQSGRLPNWALAVTLLAVMAFIA